MNSAGVSATAVAAGAPARTPTTAASVRALTSDADGVVRACPLPLVMSLPSPSAELSAPTRRPHHRIPPERLQFKEILRQVPRRADAVPDPPQTKMLRLARVRVGEGQSMSPRPCIACADILYNTRTTCHPVGVSCRARVP